MKVNCVGWWNQVGYGKQPMENLSFDFETRGIAGQGIDIVGPFTIQGVVKEDGDVTIHKQYVGQHSVTYIGYFDGEGSFQGTWHIGDSSGTWMMKVVGGEQTGGIRQLLPSQH